MKSEASVLRDSTALGHAVPLPEQKKQPHPKPERAADQTLAINRQLTSRATGYSPDRQRRRSSRRASRLENDDGGSEPDGAGTDLIPGWAGITAEVHKSRVQLWRDIKSGRFPPPIETGPNSIAWYRSEVQAWKMSRPRRTYGAAQSA